MSLYIKEKQLEILLNEFQLLSKTILTQLKLVEQLFQNNSTESFYDEIEANEIIINRLEMKIREEVIFSIFKFNPVASDLRLIISYQDLTTNMERIGDLLLNISRYLKIINFEDNHVYNSKKDLIKMMSYVSKMLRNSIISFTTQDEKQAYNVIQTDDKVDELFRQISSKLEKAYDNSHIIKGEVKYIIITSAISHSIERVGDSSTNIAETVIFISEGKNIKHGAKQKS